MLSIANKVNATILSNDTYQEFHGNYTWLFDEGRLVGGKPVPHVGWVFVNRLPVRGPTSRKSVSEAKRGRVPKTKASPEASQPMPVPAAPPPGATLQKSSRGRDEAKAAAPHKTAAHAAKSADGGGKPASEAKAEPTPKSTGTNDLLRVPHLRRASPARQQRQRHRRELLLARRVRADRRREGLRAVEPHGRPRAAQRQGVHEGRRVDHARRRELRSGKAQHRPGDPHHGADQVAPGRGRRRAGQAEAVSEGRHQGCRSSGRRRPPMPSLLLQ